MTATTRLPLVDQLLRDRGAVLGRIDAGIGLGPLARTMLTTIAISAAAFGAALGTYRGGIQIGYAALKLPLLMLLTAALCAPALTAFNAALERPASLRRDVALVLTALAFGSLVLAAEAPVLLLARALDFQYHTLILFTVGCAAVAGACSIALLAAGIAATPAAGGRLAATALVALVAVVGGQMSWTLRPFLLRPRAPEAPLFRALEGNLVEAVLDSWASAHGRYWRDEAPLPSRGEE